VRLPIEKIKDKDEAGERGGWMEKERTREREKK